jgi:hypothetical protein
MTKAQIKEIILKSHMRSEKKIIPWVHKTFPNASEEKIKKVLESMVHDKYTLSRDDTSKHYYVPIFTPFIGGFQIDLIDQSRNDPADGTPNGVTTRAHHKFPKYFLVAINVNTKYAYAYKMSAKTQAEVIRCLDLLANDVKDVGEGKLVYISADKEPAWNTQSDRVSQGILKWFTDHKCKLKLIESERHSALGVVDRFIRELRDMNVKSSREVMTVEPDGTVKGKSHDSRYYHDFTPYRMFKLIKIHNTSFNTSIGMTPEEMENDVNKQKEYIIQKVYEANRRQKISDFQLQEGSWVRFMIPRNMMRKRRYQFSQQKVNIIKKEGNAYVCEAADGTQKKLARWRLLPIEDPSKFNRLESFTRIEYWHRKRALA